MTMLDTLFSNDQIHCYEAAYAREMAAYKRALQRVIDLDPARFDHTPGTPLGPLDRMDEAVVALANAAWLAGTHVGHAFADAQASLDAEWALCQRCNGSGRRDGTPCAACGETGVVKNCAEW